jgi:hypothetical protein
MVSQEDAEKLVEIIKKYMEENKIIINSEKILETENSDDYVSSEDNQDLQHIEEKDFCDIEN